MSKTTVIKMSSSSERGPCPGYLSKRKAVDSPGPHDYRIRRSPEPEVMSKKARILDGIAKLKPKCEDCTASSSSEDYSYILDSILVNF